MHLIEFTGLPGSGKTTIRHELGVRLRSFVEPRCLLAEEAFWHIAKANGDLACRIILRSFPTVIAKILAAKFTNRTTMQFHAQNRFLARHGQALRAFFESDACQNMDEDERTGVIEAFLQTGSLTALIQDFLPIRGAVFIEEGLVQKSLMLVSLRRNIAEDHLAHAYLDAIPLPHILIHVQGDLDTCRQRMAGRPQGLTKRLRMASSDESTLFLGSIHSHLTKVIAWLRQRPELIILEADSRRPLDETVSKLDTEIRAYLSCTYPRPGRLPTEVGR